MFALRRRAVILGCVLTVVIAASLGISLYTSANVLEKGLGAGWTEIAWPFRRDAWEPGRAFRCASTRCESETELYVRPKLGFCDCTNGVSDDEEVDRVTDLDLISAKFVPMEAGQRIEVDAMPGRARHYKLQMPDGTSRSALAIAFSRRCDVVIAIAQSKSASAIAQSAALGLLASEPIRQWLDGALNGRMIQVAD
ncbi:MAG: hypothetical protein NVSMB26_17640 [Beijerinckiaceae bacterium]